MRKVKKDVGMFPETVVVLSTPVDFDAEGIAVIEDDAVFETLCQVPGYTVLDTSEDKKTPPQEDEEEQDEEEVTDTEEPKKAPPKKRPSPRTK